MDFTVAIYIAVVFVFGFIVGMIYEHYRIMTRLEDATEEEAEKKITHCCGNCIEYDGDRCTLYWNNLDESYYLPDRDDKDPYDCCDYWQLDENALGDETDE